jgi:hypothetical protein
MMSNTGEQRHTLPDAVRHLWKLGGFRAYYRGLAVGDIIHESIFTYDYFQLNRSG